MELGGRKEEGAADSHASLFILGRGERNADDQQLTVHRYRVRSNTPTLTLPITVHTRLPDTANSTLDFNGRSNLSTNTGPAIRRCDLSVYNYLGMLASLFKYISETWRCLNNNLQMLPRSPRKAHYKLSECSFTKERHWFFFAWYCRYLM